MAQRVEVVVTSDLSNDEGASPLRFGLDGDTYEIDLTPDEAARFRGLLAEYVGNARRVKSGAKPRPKLETDPRDVREWAAVKGLDCPMKGRLPKHIVDQYRTAHGL